VEFYFSHLACREIQSEKKNRKRKRPNQKHKRERQEEKRTVSNLNG
jgi:hypothetical protein